MSFIAKYWAKTGGVTALLIILFVLIYNDSLMLIQSIALINLSFLMLHQFEEYVYPGGFKNFFNTYIGGKSSIIKFPITDTGIIAVNILIGWELYLLGILFSYSIFTAVLLLTSLINGIVHTGALLRFKKYNPGFITGLFLFIPFSVYSILQLSRDSLINPVDLLIIIPFALAGTALIPFTLYLCRNKK